MILPEPTLEASATVLTEYWARFRRVYPDHEVFSMLGSEELSKAIPVRVHGDEGRSILD